LKEEYGFNGSEKKTIKYYKEEIKELNEKGIKVHCFYVQK